jgi:hypothetical protein
MSTWISTIIGGAMFDTYDTVEKKYKVVYSASGYTNELTTQELYDFYIFNTHNIFDSFEDIIKQLDNGDTIIGDDNEFDWDMGANVYQGKVKITKNVFKGMKVNHLPPPVPKTCDHKDKYINRAGGVRFYFCPSCRKDLGDV